MMNINQGCKINWNIYENRNMARHNIQIAEVATLMWQNSFLMKFCRAAEMPWPKNLQMQE